MANRLPHPVSRGAEGKVLAVLGPTNTGKTHLAIERLCAHSSGAIGFPLRLLAREVYDRVVAIKGPSEVALITGEERIEPKGARWLLCTVEAMPRFGYGDRPDLSFVALDEAQLAADRERGHIFTDRLLHARGRDETMILGSAVMEPMVRALVPGAEIVSRPRFSTLSHAGAKKLSRIPPRSAIVAFSAEQVYAVAEMLRRFRGGAAVVMGALSPETRNRQVALFQSGEVDYLVATDAIGMGLNLDVTHVAFAGLSKFDGVRNRRLTPMEMAQIAGRAGRHQRDGTFGTLAGAGGMDAEFTEEEIWAIEEHRFAPLTKIFWRDSQPRLDSLDHLIDDLARPPERPELAPAPEAIDLAVMRRLAEDPEIAASVRGRAAVARFREACSLPDFRQHGADTHARFVARLWEDLRRGYLGSDFVASRIAELDNPGGDIDTLQGRIAAIRSWSYIAQRPDWVLAREEMAARARAVEARLSDALHARLTERFVNRRTAVLMRKVGPDAALLPVTLEGNVLLVDGEKLGKLEGFHFKVDPEAHHSDHKLLFAAAERHLPQLFAERAGALAGEIAGGTAALELSGGAILNGREVLARLAPGKALLAPQVKLEPALEAIPAAERKLLKEAIDAWLAAKLAVLAPLAAVDEASRAEAGGPELRALLIRLAERGGLLERAGSGLEALKPEQRDGLRKLGVRIGAIDLFMPAMLKPAALGAWRELATMRGVRLPEVAAEMPPVLPATGGRAPLGYRRFDKQALRIDMAEKLLREAHGRRAASAGNKFWIDPALARSTGLTPEAHMHLLRIAGFAPQVPPTLGEGVFGPPAPPLFRWRPPRRAEGGEQQGHGERGRGQHRDQGKRHERGPGKQAEAPTQDRRGKDKPKGPRPPRPAPPREEAPAGGGAFAALAALVGRV
ncbi:helicase [Novosphingobium flavum]|uniref:Helicase n=1 Tax=Novosphingobium flavum TaxID=1778672 RepID=A0A7X1KKG7_9SPHN|nr:helicase-related protein [Novosphingobium flavum]MBC2664526.1 helicase [Novosphingobium flavum]